VIRRTGRLGAGVDGSVRSPRNRVPRERARTRRR
jgi:hypothetical protein